MFAVGIFGGKQNEHQVVVAFAQSLHQPLLHAIFPPGFLEDFLGTQREMFIALIQKPLLWYSEYPRGATCFVLADAREQSSSNWLVCRIGPVISPGQKRVAESALSVGD